MIEPTSRPVGAAPLFRQLADAIGVVSIVNTLVAWDPRQCRVSPGERIVLLMLDILAGKTPLYRLAERLTLTDVEILCVWSRENGSDASLVIAGEAGLTLTMERQTVRRAARHFDNRRIAPRAERISLSRDDRPD